MVTAETARAEDREGYGAAGMMVASLGALPAAEMGTVAVGTGEADVQQRACNNDLHHNLAIQNRTG